MAGFGEDRTGDAIVTGFSSTIASDAITKARGFLGVINELRKTLPILSTTHRSAMGAMLLDLTKYHEALKKVSSEYGMQKEELEKLMAVSRRFGIDQRELLNMQKGLKEVGYEMKLGRGYQSATAIQRVIDLTGGGKRATQYAAEGSIDEEYLKRFSSVYKGADKKTQAELLSASNRIGLYASPDVLNRYPSDEEKARTPTPVAATKEDEERMKAFSQVIKDINNLVAVARQNFTLLVAKLELPAWTTFLSTIKMMAEAIKWVSAWFAQASESMTSLARTIQFVLGVGLKLIAALWLFNIFQKIIAWQDQWGAALMKNVTLLNADAVALANATDRTIGYAQANMKASFAATTASFAMTLLSTATGFLASIMAYSISPIHAVIFTIQWGSQVFKLAAAASKMLTAAMAGQFAVMKAGLFWWYALLSAIVIILHYTGALKVFYDWVAKISGMDMATPFKDTTEEAKKMTTEFNKIAQTDIFGSMMEQIIGLPDRAIPPLMRMLQGTSKAIGAAVGGQYSMQLASGSNAIRFQHEITLKNEFGDSVAKTVSEGAVAL